ncbi:MBL fold metallo-hydrolase [Streptomyces radicis]|uniref:MBL fold metallo-hydrolase n=1 Tax=Streptomyces radicis TaxID=1750517 RepID=A0A3A9W2T8_9ACTN|nr:MBL fold metallo-hydrolase [Streptomyces radicis]RKN07062.1 MBL fold metallo-hydrolase [Streptomyces radicis]RKN15123.1 MBL fold metallo-hydrolase [Streptomyces radicis]
MELTKKGHACVRLTKGGRTLVIDPGAFSEEDAAAGADAVLITHEHPDHLDEGRLRVALDGRPGTEVWAPRSVAERVSAAFPGRVHTVGHGDTFEAAGFAVEAHGELHAVIHPDLPRIANVGFLVDGALFHPGDALTVPERPVRVLMLPLHAPWSKFSEVLDYVREVGAERAYAVHDGLLADAGLAVYGRNLSPDGPGTGPTAYARLAPGESTTV